jgi:hypothetical protein
MADALSDVVDVSITSQTSGVEQAGFGTEMILSAEATFPERVRTYETPAEGAVDFVAGTATRQMIDRTFGQTPRPPFVKVGRLANKPTQKWTVTPVAVDSTAYKFKWNGVEYSFTSGVGTTTTLITTGLKALINGIVGVTATATGTTAMIVTANAPGNFNSLEIETKYLSLMSIVQDHADPGVTADLDAILLEDDEWFSVVNAYNSKAMALAIAVWAEANKKEFIAQTQDSETIQVAVGSGNDFAKAVQTAAYRFTSAWYHPATSAFLDAGINGRMLPVQPGTGTFKFKTIAGVDAVKLNGTQKANLLARYANSYYRKGGKNITFEGKTGSNEFIDNVIFAEWLRARIAEDVYQGISTPDKVPMDDAGIALAEGRVQARLWEGVRIGGLLRSPAPKTTVPKRSELNITDVANRYLNEIRFEAYLAGAIHKVKVAGVLSL